MPFHKFVIFYLHSCSCHCPFMVYIATTTSFSTFSPFPASSFSFFPSNHIPCPCTLYIQFVQYFSFNSLIYLLLLSVDRPSIFRPFFRFYIFRVLYMHICLPLSPCSPHFFSPFLFLSVCPTIFISVCYFRCLITFYISLFFNNMKKKRIFMSLCKNVTEVLI